MKEGWEKRKLIEICDAKPQKQEARVRLEDNDHVSFLPMEDLGKECKYVQASKEKQLKEVINNYTYFANNDLLLAKITPCFENGKIGIARCLKNGIGFGSSEFLVLRCKEQVIPEYVYYFLSQKSIRDEGKPLMTGAVGHKRVSKDWLENYLIPIPDSKSEQLHIVSLLDECFASIEQAKANLNKNLNNAKELFQSELNQIFSQKGEGWKLMELESVVEEIFAGGDAPKENYSKEKNEKFNIPIYANAVKDKGLYGYTDKAQVTKPSVTIAARGSGTGHTELRKDAYFPIVRLIVLVPNQSIICSEFLKYSIDNIDIFRSGSAIPQLTIPMIKSYSIPVPTLETQLNIVSRLDFILEQIKKLESIYQHKLNNLEELKKSILQKAFSGELVRTPEKAFV